MKYQGSCHCGRIAFEVEGELGDVMECNCSHCQRKGFLLWFVGRDQFRLTTPEDQIATYLFNKHVIRHRFCANCGTQPFGEGVDPQGREVRAVNVRCLDPVDLAALRRIPFDGRSL
ncbi:GFA family protein [Eleftheria terrae]|uniref:GFA family protein n=1 Tax=Eleftheria terrae TaxID=1597781 RepID=UPI00263B4301|nr:GFA family protein [Eleftheria terrae]WKB51422.1 GFA family protein [Eleftheria terrae]